MLSSEPVTACGVLKCNRSNACCDAFTYMVARCVCQVGVAADRQWSNRLSTGTHVEWHGPGWAHMCARSTRHGSSILTQIICANGEQARCDTYPRPATRLLAIAWPCLCCASSQRSKLWRLDGCLWMAGLGTADAARRLQVQQRAWTAARLVGGSSASAPARSSVGWCGQEMACGSKHCKLIRSVGQALPPYRSAAAPCITRGRAAQVAEINGRWMCGYLLCHPAGRTYSFRYCTC